jgi:hypothetical protein
VGGWVTTGRDVVGRVVDRVVVGGSVEVVEVVVEVFAGIVTLVVVVTGTGVEGTGEVVCMMLLVDFIESVVVVSN